MWHLFVGSSYIFFICTWTELTLIELIQCFLILLKITAILLETLILPDQIYVVLSVLFCALSLTPKTSSHQGHAIYLWDMWEVVQTEHVFKSSLTPAFWREALPVWGKMLTMWPRTNNCNWVHNCLRQIHSSILMCFTCIRSDHSGSNFGFLLSLIVCVETKAISTETKYTFVLGHTVREQDCLTLDMDLKTSKPEQIT